jgi:hypothetical protein
MVVRFGAETEANSFYVSDHSSLSDAKGRLPVIQLDLQRKDSDSCARRKDNGRHLVDLCEMYLWYQEMAAI